MTELLVLYKLIFGSFNLNIKTFVQIGFCVFRVMLFNCNAEYVEFISGVTKLYSLF